VGPIQGMPLPDHRWYTAAHHDL